MSDKRNAWFMTLSGVSLLRGIWHGEGWSSHVGDISVLSVMFVALTMASAKVSRWE